MREDVGYEIISYSSLLVVYFYGVADARRYTLHLYYTTHYTHIQSYRKKIVKKKRKSCSRTHVNCWALSYNEFDTSRHGPSDGMRFAVLFFIYIGSFQFSEMSWIRKLNFLFVSVTVLRKNRNEKKQNKLRNYLKIILFYEK